MINAEFSFKAGLSVLAGSLLGFPADLDMILENDRLDFLRRRGRHYEFQRNRFSKTGGPHLLIPDPEGKSQGFAAEILALRKIEIAQFVPGRLRGTEPTELISGNPCQQLRFVLEFCSGPFLGHSPAASFLLDQPDLDGGHVSDRAPGDRGLRVHPIQEDFSSPLENGKLLRSLGGPHQRNLDRPLFPTAGEDRQAGKQQKEEDNAPRHQRMNRRRSWSLRISRIWS
jgi:hypothetical protein